MGLRINPEGKMFCNDIEIPATRIAAALNIDLRVGKVTAMAILQTEELRHLFTNLKSVVPLLGTSHNTSGME
jgi:predicted regulator of amino acid metabolism with ACT domain